LLAQLVATFLRIPEMIVLVAAGALICPSVLGLERLLESFVGQVAEIAVLLIFVTLGMNLPFDALGEYFFGGLLVMAVFIFVARPVTVLACLLPDRLGR
jgi:NhaP-type Na+/H+ or K+/H+ antiporter